MYVNVKQPASSASTYIGMYFATTPNTFGTFAFQGDGVIWSVASINRPNTGAFLVCPDPVEGDLLYINLGESPGFDAWCVNLADDWLDLQATMIT